MSLGQPNLAPPTRAQAQGYLDDLLKLLDHSDGLAMLGAAVTEHPMARALRVAGPPSECPAALRPAGVRVLFRCSVNGVVGILAHAGGCDWEWLVPGGDAGNYQASQDEADRALCAELASRGWHCLGVP